jgi:DNA-binding CsgD family transcriptional regulator
MEPLKRSDRLLATATVALTTLWAMTAVSMPVPGRRLATPAVAAITLLALTHAAAYWNAERLTARCRFAGYVVIQLALLFGIAVSGALFPFGLVLLLAFTARSVSGRSIATGSVVTISALGTFLLAAIATSDLYRGATAGLLLVATSIVAYALSLVIGRGPLTTGVGVLAAAPAPAGPTASANPTSRSGRAMELTVRELEVLRAVAAGSRTADVAVAMGISERTVKAHLAAIYQKLGVENRAAAVTVAMRAQLI